MKRILKYLLGGAAALVLLGMAAGLLLPLLLGGGDRVPARKFVSPDGRWVAVLENFYGFPDKNVMLSVGRNWALAPAWKVYKSGDANHLRKEGDARVLWSPDSRYLLVLGSWVQKEPAIRFAGGEEPLLLYDNLTEKLLSNGMEDRYPQLLAKDIPDSFGLKTEAPAAEK
ncbi:MAG: hypothetical protein M0011_14310 [Elusimicrobia bacterium]|nr:hypothetical protein [Elusimicrobiota bacterium]